MSQGFIYFATAACLLFLLYAIEKTGSRSHCGSYRFSRVITGIIQISALFWAIGLAFGIYWSINDPVNHSKMTSINWGLFVFLVLFLLAAIYYPSVQFKVANATLTYQSIWTTKVIDLTQPITLTCYPASGQYVVQQGHVRTKISNYISGWQYLLEEIEKQSTAMEKIHKK